MLSTDFLERMRVAFRAEAADLLDEIDRSILQLEANPSDAGHINTLFRAVHTLKGSGATAGFDRLTHFAHQVEEVFDMARDGKLQITRDIIDNALSANDIFRILVEGNETPESQALQGKLESAFSAVTGSPVQSKQQVVASSTNAKRQFLIEIRPEPGIFFSGADPAGLLEGLRELGPCQVTALLDRVPSPEQYNPEQCFLGWKVLLETQSSEADVRDVFLYVEDDCRVTILEIAQPPSATDAKRHTFLNAVTQSLDVIEFVASEFRNGYLDEDSHAAWKQAASTLAAAAKHTGEKQIENLVAQQLRLLSQSGAGQPVDIPALENNCRELRAQLSGSDCPTPEPGPEAKQPAAASASTAAKTVRVDEEKLDRLMRLVGELLVSRGAFPVLAARAIETGSGVLGADIKEAGGTVARIAEDLQATVMSIRMLPVRTITDRFSRVVRDLARKLQKEVNFVVSGEGTEIDKNILEQLGDPLVHLVRNAVDHGVESPADRTAAGKPAIGNVELRATARGNEVLIEIIDDGKGLDPALLKRKAVAKSLISETEAAAMNAEAALQLIFLPGFSTAEKISDISGRGVGMDVVRTNISRLGGTVVIDSRIGKGCRFVITLPASVSVSRGMLVSSQDCRYVLPIDNVREMVKLPKTALHQYPGRLLVEIRNTVYPVSHLSSVLEGDVRPESGITADEVSIAVMSAGGEFYGLIVDRFDREVEILTKPLTGGLEHLPHLRGAAILGDGSVVLVLNPDRLMDFASSAQQ